MSDRLAVVGASGFVGSALCERLFFEGRSDFTAFVRTSGSAARIARLGMPVRQLDLMDQAAVREALAGHSTIINCSRGDETTMIRGLKHLIAAAKRNRAARFIHLSSVAIYGDDPPPASASESCPPDPGANAYGIMKLKQDSMVLALERAGIAAYVLCPSNISGPYSPFVHGLAARLARGPLPLVDGGRHPCNLVHVDNLVEGILASERCPGASGRRYFINDASAVTWREYFEALAGLLGFQCDFHPVTREEVLRRLQPARRRAGVVEHMKIALSGEFRRGLMMMPALERANEAAARVFGALPQKVQAAVRRRFERPTVIAKNAGTLPLDEQYVRVQVRRPYHSPELAMRELGYRPVLDRQQVFATTAAWLRFAGVGRQAA